MRAVSSGRVHYAAAPTNGIPGEPVPWPDQPRTPDCHTIAWATTGGYTAAYATFVLSLCIALAPQTPYDTHAGKIPASARCLRVSRHANYATAWLPIGSPVRSAELLLRLDQVVPAADAHRALQLRSTIVSQSISKECNTTSQTCVDIAQVGRAGSDQTENEFIAFDYVSATGDYSISGTYLNLHGELSLVAGTDYYLTPTLFCWAPHDASLVPPPGAAAVDGSSGTLLTTSSEGLGPEHCNSSAVHLFPSCAAVETQWLALANRFLYEHAEEALEERRLVVERADSCANGDRTTAPYWLDCAGSLCGCRAAPSVPYRRLGAKSALIITLAGDGTGHLSHAYASTLERIPALMSTDSANWVAILRLILMVFVAGVTFIRASQNTSNTSEIVMRSWRRAHGLRPVQTFWGGGLMMNAMDAAVGILALGARVAVLISMASTFEEDGQGSLLVSETVGVIISSAHFLLRHSPILKLDQSRETPLMLFGGSMSLLDVTIAMLLAFYEAPVLGVRQSFGSVGRMLAAVLLCVNCINIGIFATTACFATTTASSTTATYRILHAAGGVLWLGQACCTALTLSAAFVVPFSYSLVRAHPGPWASVRYAVAFGFFAASGPVRRATVGEIVHVLMRGGEPEKAK